MGPSNYQTDVVECYSAFSALRASYAAFFSTYFSSVRLCQPTQFSVGDLPKAHELIAIAFWVFFLIKAGRGAWLIGLVLL